MWRSSLLAGLTGLAFTSTATLAADGAALFGSHCQACHQAGGEGASGIAPPLAGTLGKRAATAEGLAQLASTLVAGLSGPITVRGERYNGNMPAFAATLSDEQLAALLNHVLAAFNASPVRVEAALFAAARQRPAQPAQLRQQRERLLTQTGE